MLRTGLCLKNEIDGYFHKWAEEDYAGDELTPEDWNILWKIKAFLKKLKMTTKALERRLRPLTTFS